MIPDPERMPPERPIAFAAVQAGDAKRRDWNFFGPFAVGFGLTCLFMLSACSVATLPIKATGKVVDWSTTSQDEADRNLGREMRRQDEAYAQCRREGHSDC